MTTGERIKELRKKLGFTQKQLAEAAEISEAEISLIEKNKRFPSSPVICLIADKLNTTTDYLYCRVDNPDFHMDPKTPLELQKQLFFLINEYYKKNKE